MGHEQSGIRGSPPLQQPQPGSAGKLGAAVRPQERGSKHQQVERALRVTSVCQRKIPHVPNESWYAQPFTEANRSNLTDLHVNNPGNVLFSSGCIPATASELEKLPGGSPQLCKSVELGKDLLYGMAYLHNTPLFIEHQWRLRVAHCSKVSKLPPKQQQQYESKKEQQEGKHKDPLEVEGEKMGFQRGLKTLYNRPYFDTFIGIKVFVNDKMIPDRYPEANSLSNCTSTIFSSEAFNNWICVPFVLVGYLNNFTLSTITLYRFLSLNFVEYMLRQPLSSRRNSAHEEEKEVKNDTTSGEAGGGDGDRTKFTVRVEVVYGCRSEMSFCSEHISKGSVELVMTGQSKMALKSYRDRLWKLIGDSHKSYEQVVPMNRLTLLAQQQENNSSRGCLFCRSPLEFTCTICGAQLCGTTMCVWQPFPGYPRGCSMHKAQS